LHCPFLFLYADYRPIVLTESLEEVYRTFDAPLLRAKEFGGGHVSDSYIELLWEEAERELEGPLTRTQWGSVAPLCPIAAAGKL
jgi:hypothetical protein